MAVGTLRELERSYFDLRWHMDPVAATQAGVTAYDDRYGEYTVPALAAHLAALKSLATALEETTSDVLDDEIDRTALLNEIRVALRVYEVERPQARSPEFWLSHLLGGLHHLLLRADRGPEARAAALAARLEQAPRLLEEARATLTEPVRVFAETGLRIAEGGLALIRQAAAVEGAHAPALAARLEAAGDAAAGALAGFTHDLERWTETGSEHFAVGEDGLNFRLHYEHALRDTAPELWRYGHRLKEEVQAELSERARRLDAKTQWPDLVDRLRAEHPTADELVAAYTAEMRRAREFVVAHDLVPVPEAPLEVVPTPAFMRPVIPFAAYDSPGAYSPNRTGWFYVTVPDPALPAARRERMLRDHCRYELAVTALHEGFPGHHLHLVQAQAQASHVRKNLATPLTIEGWALYCEDMMAEQGFYAKEEERFFQRVHLLWRAVRVLLDVGLHTRGMTIEQAVDMMVHDLHLERSNAEDEVRRYCATPGYQLCYAVGRRELLRLREDFHAARKRAFTLRAFHDAILPYGGLSVTLMRWGLGLGG
jgi:uncharacterized protein (DUF885 family)